jgi:hypothetical protein
MCSVLLDLEADGLKHMDGRESEKRLARGAPAFVRLLTVYKGDAKLTLHNWCRCFFIVDGCLLLLLMLRHHRPPDRVGAT